MSEVKTINNTDDGKWLATAKYVVPIGDLKWHQADSKKCWCKPTADDGLIIHNSMDGRELYERGERKPS